MSDIIVIGGGIAGLSAAARLSETAQVTVLEREKNTGYHTSGRSAAMFEENYGLPSTVALNKASKTYLFEAEGGYLTPRGFLICGGATEREAVHADAVSLGAEPLSVAEAQALVPILSADTVAFAAYHAEAFDIDTDRLMQDLVRVIRGNGGQVITGAAVTGIDPLGPAWKVSTTAQTYQADMLVNAAGAWADDIARLAGIAPIGLAPLRRSMARIAAPGGQDVSHWPMFFGVGESWYAKPDAGALLVSPAEEDPSAPSDAWADDMVLAEGIARYQHHVTEPVTRPIATWAGLRSFAPDRALVLGPDPETPSFIWSAGQGGYGFQTAPAASQLVADLAFGRAPMLAADVVAQLTPDRLRR